MAVAPMMGSCCDNSKKYISYFQTVTTIGVISTANSKEEAIGKSTNKVNNSEFTCGVIGQTPLEHSGTEEWKSIDISNSNDLGLGDSIKSKIAASMGKSQSDLSEADLVAFVDKAIIAQAGA